MRPRPEHHAHLLFPGRLRRHRVQGEDPGGLSQRGPTAVLLRAHRCHGNHLQPDQHGPQDGHRERLDCGDL